MREIKFRAWDKTRIVMIGIGYPNNWGDDKDEWWADNDKMCLEGISDASSNENLHLMQYTGLKDKNGVEIYEGDIVELFDVTIRGSMYGETIKDEVDFLDACFVVGSYDLRDYVCKVIGNIYENKDLLNP